MKDGQGKFVVRTVFAARIEKKLPAVCLCYVVAATPIIYSNNLGWYVKKDTETNVVTSKDAVPLPQLNTPQFWLLLGEVHLERPCVGAG